MESAPASPSDQIAIMTPDGNIFLSDIHCRIVSDIPAGSGFSTAEEEPRARRSVCFENLTLLQMKQIDHFIHTLATKRLH